jgi:hypothetical protein
MLFAPEAVVEGLAPLTSTLFAPEAVEDNWRPLFDCGFGPGRYSSLGGGRPAPSRFGECPLDGAELLGARGDCWRERFDGSYRSISGDLRSICGEWPLLGGFSLDFSNGDLGRGLWDCLGGDRLRFELCSYRCSEAWRREEASPRFGLGERPRLSNAPESRWCLDFPSARISELLRSGDRFRDGGGSGDRVRRFLSGREDVTEPASSREGLRDVTRLDFLWWLRVGEELRLLRRLADDGEWWALRFGLSEPRVSSSSLPLFLSRTSSLESLKGDRDCLRLRSRLRSRGLSPPCCVRGLDLIGLRSLALGSLSLSRRREAGDLDLLGRVTPRSTLPRSLRSSPWLQLSFIATYRAGECCVKEVIVAS